MSDQQQEEVDTSHLDDGSDDDDLYDDGPEEPEPAAAAPAPPAAPAAPAPIRRRKRRGNGGNGAAPAGVGAAPPPRRIGVQPETKWRSNELEYLWPEMLERLASEAKNTPYELIIRIARIEPGPRQSLGTLEPSAFMGSPSDSPVDQLIAAIEDNFHIPTAPQGGPSKYEVVWCWKVNGYQYARTTWQCPAVAQIANLRNAAMFPGMFPNMASHGGMGGMPMPPRAYPQQQPFPQYAPQQPPPQQQQQPQGPQYYPYPFPFPQHPGHRPEPPRDPRESDEIRAMREELRVLRAQVAPQQPPVPPAGAGAPPIQDIVELVAARVLGALRPEGAAAAPTAIALRPPAAVAGEARSGVGALRELVATVKELKGLGVAIDEVFNGPQDDDPEPVAAGLGAPATIVEEKEEDDFIVSDLGKWTGAGERPSRIVRDRKTRDIDYVKTLFANPVLIEMGMEKLGSSAGEILNRLMVGTGAAPAQQLPAAEEKPAQQQAATEEEKKPDNDGWNFG